MSKRIPIKAAKHFADKYKCRQVVLLAWDGDLTHVVTYGGSPSDSDQAAEGGNRVKRALGWPDSLMTESPKVAALNKRIEEMQQRIDHLEEHRRKEQD